MFSKSVISKVSALAKSLDVEPAALLAVAEVESAGVYSWGGRPPIRFEGHYFYKLLSGAKRAKAVKMGLASPRAGAVKNPSSWDARYALLQRAREIDVDAANASTSWGIGQVMGDHWKKLGFPTVAALVKMADSGVDGQIEIMARFIKKFGLVDELQRKGWKDFARQYNGKNYASNRYDTKMASAYKTYTKVTAGWVDTNGEVMNGNDSVKIIQRDLKRLGFYKGVVDGISSPKTTAAVKAFQKSHGLVADGKYGKMTDEAVDAEIAKLDKKSADNNVRNGGVATGVGAATEVVNDQVSHLEMFTGYSDTITYIVIALVLVGLGLTVYGLWSKYKASQNTEV